MVTKRYSRKPWAFSVSLIAATTVAATHIGYPCAVRAAARRARAESSDEVELASPADPSLTVVIPAHDEARFIQAKLLDTLAQEYSHDELEILVLDDGSSDGTADIARGVEHRCVRVIEQPDRRGKAAALNRAVRAARGEFVVFTDANGSLVPGSLRAIVAGFDNSQVAVVSGRKQPVGSGAHGAGELMYWTFEAKLKEAESAFGAVVGADGGIYAVRKSTYKPIPEDIYADDYWIPIDSLRRGLLVRHAMGACATEAVSMSKYDDFERRQRIAAGIWQVSLSNIELARPDKGWISTAFVCHRILRTMVAPPLLLLVLLGSWRAGRRGSVVMRGLTVAQLAAWAAAGVGAVSDARLFAVPYQFAMANVAAVGGGLRHFRGRQSAHWRRGARGQWHPVKAALSDGFDQFETLIDKQSPRTRPTGRPACSPSVRPGASATQPGRHRAL